MSRAITLPSVPALGYAAYRGTFGAPSPHPKVYLHEIGGFHLMAITAHPNMETGLRERLHAGYGIALPGANRCTRTEGMAALSAGPRQWLALTRMPLDHRPLAEVAWLTDLSDARAMVSISGESAASLLAKGSSIDLSDSAFGAGSAALTRLGHFSVVLWRPEEERRYLLLAGRSYAVSLWQWLIRAGEEFGGAAGGVEAWC